jgi:hypothetical protein
MIFNYTSGCAYCGSPIGSGHRWVREKIYERAPVDGTVNYRRYHADLFPGHELSCWQKHELEVEIARIKAYVA